MHKYLGYYIRREQGNYNALPFVRLSPQYFQSNNDPSDKVEAFVRPLHSSCQPCRPYRRTALYKKRRSVTFILLISHMYLVCCFLTEQLSFRQENKQTNRLVLLDNIF